MLDSSPMPTYQPPPAPSKTRSLKRSASVASLPTPPRSLDKTQRKRDVKRRRGDDSGSDTGGEETADEHIPKQFHGKLDFGVKPLKALAAGVSSSNDPFSDVVEPTKTPIATTPLSPEKSPSPRGKAARAPPPLTPSPTRITRATAKKLNIDMPVRDTPNNPFLDSEHNGLKKKRTSSKLKQTTTASPKLPYEEQPTLTYVFRGQKTEFVNPHYKLSKEALLASQLPVEHVDYEASETLKPMRLFKDEMAKRKKATPEPEGSAEGSQPKTPRTPKTPKTPVKTPVRGKNVKASGGGGGGGWSSSEDESSPKPKTPKRRIARKT